MGRRAKEGLDYFELDCHMDDKIGLIQAEYGLKGFAIVVKLFQKIYGECGYYCEWNKDLSLLFASKDCAGGTDGGDMRNLIEEVVSACIRRDIFSERLFKKYGILTSAGIQKQYLGAVYKREKVELKKEYLLVSVPENAKNVVVNAISDVRNAITDVRNPQSIVEKRRVEESKGENICKRAARAQPDTDSLIAERGFPPELDEAVREWVDYKKEKRQTYHPIGFRNFLSQVERNAERYGADAVADLIRYCMANNWQGVAFDRLERRKGPDKNNTGWPVVGGVDWSKV